VFSSVAFASSAGKTRDRCRCTKRELFTGIAIWCVGLASAISRSTLRVYWFPKPLSLSLRCLSDPFFCLLLNANIRWCLLTAVCHDQPRPTLFPGVRLLWRYCCRLVAHTQFASVKTTAVSLFASVVDLNHLLGPDLVRLATRF
jgi:hypothetical protein